MTRPPRSGQITLRIVSGPSGEVPPPPFTIAGGRATIGRHADNAWVLPDSSASVSREHAVIEGAQGGWQIIDKSANGTFVNGHNVGNGNAWPLSAGDSIRIGGYEITVEMQSGHGDLAPATRPPPISSASFDLGDLARSDFGAPRAAPRGSSPLDPISEERPPELTNDLFSELFSELGDHRTPLSPGGAMADPFNAPEQRGLGGLSPDTSPFEASPAGSPFGGPAPANRVAAPAGNADPLPAAPPPQRSAFPNEPDPLAALPDPFDQRPMTSDDRHAPPQSPFALRPAAIPNPVGPGPQQVLPTDWDDGQTSDLDPIEAALAALAPKTGSRGSAIDGDGDTVVSVFAPDLVAVGDTAMVQVFLHLQAQSNDAADIAREFDAAAVRRGARMLAATIPPGARVHLTLSLPGLAVEPAVDTVVWNRQPESAQFAVMVPADRLSGTAIGTVRVLIDGTPIGELRFKMKLLAGKHPVTDSGPAAMSARRYRRAFASYASPDRAEVLRRVQGLRRVGIEVFQDVLDLEPGERWERKLYQRIDECDVVLLFWSNSARNSKWVELEIDYALARQLRERGDDDAPDMPAIEPLPIEGPPIPEPPERLRHLHFNDALLYAIAGEDRVRTH